MDIAAMSVVMNQAQVKQQASVSVMKSVMTTTEQNGEALIEMMQVSKTPKAPRPNLGGKIDVKA